MAKTSGQKLKILYLLRLLEKNSDEEHPLTTAEIISYFESIGIGCERKSLYDDIAKLQEFGYDIIQISPRQGGGYYLAEREFELPELKLLVDAVSSSRFITTKKSRELIKKLEEKASKYDAGKLRRQVYVAGRIKTENESIYYSIDSIHRAIQENKKISFDYMDWDENKELSVRPGGMRIVSPWALIWKDENYYLMAYDEKDFIMKHYRVDKMGHVDISKEKRLGMELFEKIDMAGYANQTFGMFGGKQETVSLSIQRPLLGVVLDRFGKEVDLRKESEEAYRIRAKVTVSGQFFGWLCGVGKGVKIIGPNNVKEQYRKWLEDILREDSSEDSLV